MLRDVWIFVHLRLNTRGRERRVAFAFTLLSFKRKRGEEKGESEGKIKKGPHPCGVKLPRYLYVYRVIHPVLYYVNRKSHKGSFLLPSLSPMSRLNFLKYIPFGGGNELNSSLQSSSQPYHVYHRGGKTSDTGDWPNWLLGGKIHTI